MPWFKVDDGFANSKPVLRIPRRHRAAAVGLWVMAGTWSAKELTDGFVPDYTLDDFCSTAALAEHLVRSGLWETAEEGWQFVGWEKYQFTKAKVLEHRAAEAEKKRKWREAKSGAPEQGEPDMSPSLSPGDSIGTPEGTNEMSRLTRPDQTRPVPSLVTSGGELTQVSRFCPRHPNGTDVPCTACATARRAYEAREQNELDAKRRQREEIRAAREACNMCDENGMRAARGGLKRCDHQVTEELLP